jgi:hypothetical protein
MARPMSRNVHRSESQGFNLGALRRKEYAYIEISAANNQPWIMGDRRLEWKI